MDEEIDTTDLPPQNSLEQYYGFAHPILPDSTSNCADLEGYSQDTIHHLIRNMPQCWQYAYKYMGL